MNKEIKGYLKAEAIISAAFNFFINGMIVGVQYHNVDFVPTNIVSIAIDLTATCLLMFLITTPFCKASLKRTKTTRILPNKSRVIRRVSRLFRRPALFVVFMALLSAAVLYIPTSALFLLFGIYEISFCVYLALKIVFCAVFGGFITTLELYSGMCKTE